MSANSPRPEPTRQLPPQPNLEQLRKQAKELLDLYRSSDPAAVAEVQRFELHPNPTSFALHDAQRVLARAYGYASWSNLKAFTDGINVHELAAAVQRGDIAKVRAMLHSRPELVGMDMSANNEHRALHYAVLRRDPAMVRLLMEAGADPHKGIYPHRDATSALALANHREYHDIVAIIQEEERRRREELSCPNATVSPVQDQINEAIAEGDNATAIRLLEADGSLIQACDSEGATPLHIAAEEANSEMLSWLLAHRAKLNKQDVNGLTALDRASFQARGDEFRTIANLLIDHGAEITIRAAVALADPRKISELIQADPASLRQVGKNGGLLTLAVKHNHLEIVRLLLDLGVDVDERIIFEELEEPTLSWGYPLWHAARENQLEIARLLLDRGADPNSNVYASGWPLANAWYHPDDSLKKLLLARGAKVQPYMISETHNVSEAQHLLASDPSEALAQELAWSAADQGCPEILELALARLTWPPNDPRWHWIIIQPIRGASGDHAKNAAHFACMSAILRHGVDPNVSRYGQTVLHFAAYLGPITDADRAQFAALLLDHGANPNLRDDLLQSTPLTWAHHWNRPRLAALLNRDP